MKHQQGAKYYTEMYMIQFTIYANLRQIIQNPGALTIKATP